MMSDTLPPLTAQNPHYLSPWGLAAKPRSKPCASEDQEQAALIAWSKMAARCGFVVANDPNSYPSNPYFVTE